MLLIIACLVDCLAGCSSTSCGLFGSRLTPSGVSLALQVGLPLVDLFTGIGCFLLCCSSIEQELYVVRIVWLFCFHYCIYLRISRQFLAQFRRSSCGGRLIRRSCHTARVDSQHDGYLSAHCMCVPHTAWTISRSLGLCVYVGESTSAGF